MEFKVCNKAESQYRICIVSFILVMGEIRREIHIYINMYVTFKILLIHSLHSPGLLEQEEASRRDFPFSACYHSC